jgi:hypothetical protein
VYKCFVLFAAALLFDEKIRQSTTQVVFPICFGDTDTKHKMYDSCIFRERFVEKESGWHTTKPSAKDL